MKKFKEQNFPNEPISSLADKLRSEKAMLHDELEALGLSMEKLDEFHEMNSQALKNDAELQKLEEKATELNREIELVVDEHKKLNFKGQAAAHEERAWLTNLMGMVTEKAELERKNNELKIQESFLRGENDSLASKQKRMETEWSFEMRDLQNQYKLIEKESSLAKQEISQALSQIMGSKVDADMPNLIPFLDKFEKDQIARFEQISRKMEDEVEQGFFNYAKKMIQLNEWQKAQEKAYGQELKDLEKLMDLLEKVTDKIDI